MKSCGKCNNFVRIKSFTGGGRAGICDKFDFCVKCDDKINCKSFKSKKYERKALLTNSATMV